MDKAEVKLTSASASRFLFSLFFCSISYDTFYISTYFDAPLIICLNIVLIIADTLQDLPTGPIILVTMIGTGPCTMTVPALHLLPTLRTAVQDLL